MTFVSGGCAGQHHMKPAAVKKLNLRNVEMQA
jgi:hypothetical protein